MINFRNRAKDWSVGKGFKDQILNDVARREWSGCFACEKKIHSLYHEKKNREQDEKDEEEGDLRDLGMNGFSVIGHRGNGMNVLQSSDRRTRGL